MKTEKTLKALTFLGVAALVGAFTSQAVAQQLEIKLGHNGSPGSLFDASANEFAKMVNPKLGDKAKVVVYGSEQLGKDEEMLKKLRLGTAHLALNSTIMAQMVDVIGLFELPYLVRDREHMKRIEKEVFWPMIAPIAEKKNFKILAVWENGFRHITNNKQPIVKPADLAGIKLRIPESPVRMNTFKAYGANPVAMPFTEVFGALQQNIIDGQENPMATIYQASIHEVQKYLSLTGHVYSAVHLLMNKKLFDSLSPDLQKILVDAGKETAKYTRQLGADADSKLADVMKQKGIQVNTANAKSFVDVSKPVWKMITDTNKFKDAPELMDKIAALGK